MASNSYQLSSTGTLLWLNQPTKVDLPALVKKSLNYTNISGLHACDLKTNVIGQSIKIQTEAGIIFHLPLNTITSCDIMGNRLQINSSDMLPFSLTFVDAADALIAADNLDIAMNGGYIDCGESILSSTNPLNSTTSEYSYPALLFITDSSSNDPILIGRVASDEDLISQVNEYAAPYYFISLSGTTVNLSTYKRYTGSLPFSFTILTKWFGGTYNSNNLTMAIDYPNSDFWVYDGESGDTILHNTANVNVKFPSAIPRTFEVYYTEDFLPYLNLSGIGLSQIVGTIPSGLQKFYADAAQLTGIEFISSTVDLKSLVVKKSPLAMLPSSLNSLNKLVTLDLGNCLFAEFPVVDAMASLATLTVTNNSTLTTTPLLSGSSEIKNMYFLNCGSLSTFNDIPPSVTSFSVISSNMVEFEFPNQVNLWQINLSGCQLATVDLFNCINPKLTNINLSNNKLDLNSTSVLNLLSQLTVAINGTLDLTLNLQSSITPEVGFLNAVNNLQILNNWTVLY